MRNYFNKLCWKISLNYTLSRHKTQVLKVSGSKESLKTNIELEYQIIVLAIKFRKKNKFAKVLIPTTLFRKFLSLQFTASVNIKENG